MVAPIQPPNYLAPLLVHDSTINLIRVGYQPLLLEKFEIAKANSQPQSPRLSTWKRQFNSRKTFFAVFSRMENP